MMLATPHTHLKGCSYMGTQQPTFLLIGTGHWSNPGLDIKSVAFDDMLAPGRQRQISDVVQHLAEFGPTKVALEITPESETSWNRDYSAFRQGRYELTANERHQLGFRIASTVGLEKINGIDWHDPARPIPWKEAFDFAQDHDQNHLIGFYHEAISETEDHKKRETQRLAQTTIREQLMGSDDVEGAAIGHKVYMDIAQIGTATNFIGAEVALRWYERNMMMFANLARLAESDEDRVLVVVGGGHLPLLRHYLEGSMRFRIDSVGRYLRTETSD
jgi:hypothetical protein